MTKRALAVVAHPDDIEFMMAGTLMHLGRVGYELHYMTVANGSCGSVTHDARETARIRRQESMAAAGLLGAVYHESLCNDLEIFYDLPTLRRLTAVVREVAPTIVLTHPPRDYMEDHMNTCRLILTAAFALGVPNFAAEPARDAIEQEVTVYHALPYGLREPLGGAVQAEFYVDVSNLMQAKQDMLALHRSQRQWLDVSQGVDSFLGHAQEIGAAIGQMSGRFTYAEGWTRHLHFGYAGADADPLRDALTGLWVDHPSD